MHVCKSKLHVTIRSEHAHPDVYYCPFCILLEVHCHCLCRCTQKNRLEYLIVVSRLLVLGYPDLRSAVPILAVSLCLLPQELWCDSIRSEDVEVPFRMRHVTVERTSHFHEITSYRVVYEPLEHCFAGCFKGILVCVQLSAVPAGIMVGFRIGYGIQAHRTGLEVNEDVSSDGLPYKVNASYYGLSVLFHTERPLMVCLHRWPVRAG